MGLAKREELVVREGQPDLRLSRRSRACARCSDCATRRIGSGSTTTASCACARIGSALDHVPGVGPARRAALLKAFGSVAALAAASADEIAERAGVPRALAERVLAHLAERQGGRVSARRIAALERPAPRARRRAAVDGPTPGGPRSRARPGRRRCCPRSRRGSTNCRRAGGSASARWTRTAATSRTTTRSRAGTRSPTGARRA